MKKREAKICGVCIFLLLFMTSSFNVTNGLVSGRIVDFLWMLPMILAIPFIFGGKFRTDSLWFAVFIVASRFLTTVIKGENASTFTKGVIAIAVAFVIVQFFSMDTVLKTYTKLVRVLCVLSLACYVITLLNSGFLASINSASIETKRYYNLYFCVGMISKAATFPRNYGMFWEPGAFQTFIILSMVIDIFGYRRATFGNMLLYSATILTTFSTTGYIALALVYLLMLFDNKSIKANRKASLVFIIAVIAVIIYYNKDIFFSTSTGSVFGKVIRLSESGVTNASHSEGVRVASVIEPLKMWVKNPIFGMGRANMQSVLENTISEGMATCTFVNWFAVYGTLYGIVMMLGFYRFSSFLSGDSLQRAGIFVILMVIIMSENYVDNAAIIMIAMMGFGYYGRKKAYDNIAN